MSTAERGRAITEDQLLEAWTAGYRVGRSARLARRLGIYEERPDRPQTKGNPRPR